MFNILSSVNITVCSKNKHNVQKHHVSEHYYLKNLVKSVHMFFVITMQGFVYTVDKTDKRSAELCK